MATVTASGSLQTIATTPFLIKKQAFTGGTTAAALSHGEDRAPDIVFFCQTGTSSTATNFFASTIGSSTVTVDSVNDSASDVGTMYMIWFDFATGGLNNVA